MQLAHTGGTQDSPTPTLNSRDLTLNSCGLTLNSRGLTVTLTVVSPYFPSADTATLKV